MYLTFLCILLCLTNSLHVSKHEKQEKHMTFNQLKQEHKLITPVHEANWGHFNNEANPPQNQLNPTWMRQFPDSKLVSYLSIPGTHDTGTYPCQWYKFCSITQCQTWNIYGQLLAGIRYLDLRVDISDTLGLGHGPIHDFMRLEQALQQVSVFLKNFPSEFVILDFQKNSGEGDPSQKITKMFTAYNISAVFRGAHTSRQNPDIPTLGQLRGKAWIFSQYTIPFGYKTYMMDGSQGITDNQYIYRQNIFSVQNKQDIANKVNAVVNTAFNVECEAYRMKINFLSCTGGLLPPTPQSLARRDGGPNQVMDRAIKAQPRRKCLGITIMDFPGASLISWIIDSSWAN